MEEDNAINSSQPVIKFNENFWGEKFTGWEVLYKNLRCSLASVKEFEQYLRECATTEDAYVKSLDKLKIQILKFASDSSISPIWHNILKELNHSNSSAHLHFKYRIEELIKEIQNYHDDLRKKKQKIKESETKTLQLVELIRTLSGNLAKSKEMFFQANLEVEKQSSEISQTATPSLASQITLQKLERKCQSLKDEYLNAIEKYNSTRLEYEQKFTESCNLFQHEEELHLKKMRKFILNYAQLVAQLNSSRQKNFNDCQQQLNNVYTNEMLMQQLVVSKATGQDRPTEAVYAEPNFESADLRSTTRASFSSQNIHRSPTLLDSPDAVPAPPQEELKLNPDYDTATLYSSSVPNNSTSTPKQTTKLNPKTVELKKKPDGKTFNLLDMFGRSTKSTKSEIIANSKKSKPNESLTKSSLSSSYSFLPNFLLSSSNKEESKLDDSESILSSKKAVEAVTDTFNKQLKQIDSFEREEKFKHTVRSSSTDPMDIKFNSVKSDDEASSPSKRSGKQVKKGIRFEMDESPTGDCATSPINLIKKRDDKPSVGSLMTATSLDNAMFDNTGLFDNLEDYVDSVNSNSLVANPSYITNQMNQANNPNRGPIYAFSESSDEELKEETNSKTTTLISQQVYSNPIPPDEIEDNTDDDLNDSDNDSDDSDAPKRVFLKIKPLSEVNLAASPEVLREISKNLQLRPNSAYTPRRQLSAVKKNEIFQTPATESFTSISSINNMLPSSSPSLLSDREAASRSQSAIDNQLAKLDENNNNVNTNIVFQMDKPSTEAPPLPPLPPNLKQKYHDIIMPQYNKSSHNNSSNTSQTLTQMKSDSSLENLNYDCWSDLSMNNSPITNVSDDQTFAKF